MQEMQMRTTIDLDETVLRQAQDYAPGMTKTALIEEGLRALVQRESARRLAAMIGTQRALRAVKRRKLS
jgi:Arc/MetJ family transcription regulator